MGSRKETEKTKLIQEKCQNMLTLMLRDEDNKYCVDCDSKGPRWASWNIGVFLCIRCAGIHRNLGVHISRVKSVNLDTWTPEQVVSLQHMGNSRARAVYEAQLPDGFRRPQNDSALESFIRAKYEHKKYLAREWVATPPPKVDWNKEIDDEIERLKRKKKSSSGLNSIILSSPSVVSEKKTSTVKSSPLPAPPLAKPKANANSPKSTRIELNNHNHSADLLGLTSPVSNANTSTTSQQSNNQSLNDSNDVFSNFLSGPNPVVAPPVIVSNSALLASITTTATENGKQNQNVMPILGDNLAKQEADFFNQSIPNEKEKAKLTKDSILALYSAAPPANNFNPSAGGFMTGGFQQQPQQQQFMGMSGMKPQQQNQYPMMQQQFGQQMGGGSPQQQNFMGQNFNLLNNITQHSQPQQTQQQTNGLNNLMNLGTSPQQMSQFNQPPINNQQQFGQFTSANFPTNNQTTSASPASKNINQQFGNMNLGNVWQ